MKGFQGAKLGSRNRGICDLTILIPDPIGAMQWCTRPDYFLPPSFFIVTSLRGRDVSVGIVSVGCLHPRYIAKPSNISDPKPHL